MNKTVLSWNWFQSARSGSLLLTAANLAQIHPQIPEEGAISTRDLNIQYYLEKSNKDNAIIAALPKTCKQPEPDNVSIASSMHFTVVNINSRPSRVPKRSFCRKHQLTILVLSMSALFTIGIIAAIYVMESKFIDLDSLSQLFIYFFSEGQEPKTILILTR